MRVRFQTKILLLVVAGVSLPALFMGWYLLQRNEELLSEKVEETLSNHLFRTSAVLDDWMQQRVHEVSRWAASFIVFESVEALTGGGGDPAKARRDLEAYLESVFGHYQNYESLFVIDTRGRVLASTRQERWEDWSRGLLVGGLPRGGTVSPIHRSGFLGRPTLLVLYSVQGRSSERVIGYLVERVDLREVENLLHVTDDDPPHNFWLLDPQGRVLVRAGKVPAAPGESAFEGTLPEAGKETGTIGRASLGGVPSIYGVRRLRGPTGGLVAAAVSARAAYRPLTDSRNRLLRLGLPLVGVVLLATFLAGRSLLRPIFRLAEAARDISKGDLDVSLPVHGRDEMADLTRAFNEMALRVRESQRTLESLAITDGLTGLYNRRHFEDTFDKELRRCEREGRTSSLLLLDLDGFKAFNDRWGHTQGDAELKRVAAALKESIRATDVAFRYGGEELAVLLHSCGKEQARHVAEKIVAAVRAPALKAGALEGRTTTVSVGVSTYPEDGHGVKPLVDAADAALYAAKAQGRDRVVVAGGPDAGRTDGAAAHAS